MTQSGGPAAINGFLYQIVQHIGWIARAALTQNTDNNEELASVVILEPADGGDAQAIVGTRYIVEQYKSRQQTFAIGDIEAALTDLRKAARPSHGRDATYRIVTNARSGKIGAFREFHFAVQNALSHLDLDDIKNCSIGQFTGTHRAYFLHLSNLRLDLAVGNAEDSLFHVLKQLELVFNRRADIARQRLELLLRPFAPELGSESKAIEHLIGIFVDRLATGSVNLEARDFSPLLSRAGINPDRLFNASRLTERLERITQERLDRVGYKRALDVRESIEVSDADVVVFTGQSGRGKSWSLARTVTDYAQKRQVQSFVIGARSAQDLLAQVSVDVWNLGMNETSVRPWTSARAILREIGITTDVLVALDDVQDPTFAQELARTDWRQYGIRLVMTVPESVATSLSVAKPMQVECHTIDDFTVDELETYLDLHGRSWSELPLDQKRLLRQPILAGLFVGLPYSSFRLAPRSEYEIFEAFWKRIQLRGRLGDEGVLLALGNHFLLGGAYPLPRSEWSTIGLTDAGIIERLVVSGWAKVDQTGGVTFSHDRLLNWVIAKNIALAYATGKMDAGAAMLAATCGKMFGSPSYWRLRYVAMDLLWMVTELQSQTMMACLLLQAFEDSFSLQGHLYDLLPTLGKRAVPVLLMRLENAISEDLTSTADEVGGALAAVAVQEGVDSMDIARPMLHGSSRTHTIIALKIFATRPTSDVLDQVWYVHQHFYKGLEDRSSYHRYSDHEASSAALRVCVECDPSWIRARIMAADPNVEQVSELARLLFNLEHQDANGIWCATRAALIKHTEPDKQRALLNCLTRFGCQEDVGFIASHLSNDLDHAVSAAFQALCHIDSRRAVKELSRVAYHYLVSDRHDWMPILLHMEPLRFRAKLLEVARSIDRGDWFVASLFEECPDEMNVSLLGFLLREAESRLSLQLQTATLGDCHWITQPLELFPRVTKTKLLRVIRGKLGLALTATLVQLEHRRKRIDSGSHDYIGEAVKKFMLVARADALPSVVERELNSSQQWVRIAGLKWAHTLSTPSILSRLTSISRHANEQGRGSQLDSAALHELYLATTALAALGADAELVTLFFEIDSARASLSLASLRSFRGPMDKALTKKAFETLGSAHANDDLRVQALLVAWLSADTDFIPPIRSILVEADPESLVARLCCIALLDLGDRDPEIVPHLTPMLRSQKNATLAINLLLATGELGIASLKRWAEANSTKDPEVVLQILRRLKHTSAAQFVSHTARSMYLSNVSHLDSPFDLIDLTLNTALSGRIFDEAFSESGVESGRSLKAIEAIGRIDVVRATEAAVLALESMPKNERQLCRFVLRWAATRAAELLVGAARKLRRKSLVDEVGRTLRHVESASVEHALAPLLLGSRGDRELAAQISAWCADQSLLANIEKAAKAERFPTVRIALLQALRRRRHDSNVLELFRSFRNASPLRRWGILTSILESTDAFLLIDSSDILYLGQIFAQEMPEIYVYHANQKLRVMCEKINSARRAAS